MHQGDIKFIKSRKDWIKIWDFHFSLWFLERITDIHFKFAIRLGNENRNTLHILKDNSESAYFLKKEIETLKSIRKKKLISKYVIEKHHKDANLIIKKFNDFLQNELKLTHKYKKNSERLFFKYSDLLEELLSYYRASRPEIFEIVEEILNNKKLMANDKKYYKSLILKYGELRLEIKKAWLKGEVKVRKLKIYIAKLLDLKLEEFEYLFNDEIKTLLEDKNSFDYRKVIKKRKFCVFGIIKGKKILISRNSEVKIIAKYLEPKIKQKKRFLAK